MTTLQLPRVAAADLPPDWIAARRALIRREGHALRPAAFTPVIFIRSPATHDWLALGLPGGGTAFATLADRDATLAALLAP